MQNNIKNIQSDITMNKKERLIMIVTFCGHKDDIYKKDTEEKLYEILEELIKKGANEFLLGGYGSFDSLAAVTVRNLKKKYPDIKSVLVIPYINRECDEFLYDCSWYPDLENVPKRFAISKRNECMVNKSDVVVAYVQYGYGGALNTLEYAKRKGKEIINLAKPMTCTLA